MIGVQKIVIVGLLTGVISLGFTCERHKKLEAEHSPVPVTKDSEPAGQLTSTFSQSSEATRLVLVEHCGKCHQSTLSSHKPGALAIFDLDAMEDWHVKLTEDNLEGISGRTRNKSITDQERAAIREFLTLKEVQLQ